jgi:large subunit ribosomal protein L23
MDKYDVIKRPILTEKSYASIPNKTYTFEVAINATKTEIKEAIEAIFDVKVEKVRTIRTSGKLRRQGRFEGYTPDGKKAIVTLTEKSKNIAFFDSLA